MWHIGFFVIGILLGLLTIINIFTKTVEIDTLWKGLLNAFIVVLPFWLSWSERPQYRPWDTRVNKT